MSTAHNTSEACHSIPPVLVDYTPKGSYENGYAGFNRVYVTGDESETALIVVYDIFGYFPQTLQGADILAKAVGARVLMPDFFGEGNTFDLGDFPPKDEEAKEKLRVFLEGVANPPTTATKLVDFAHALKGKGYKKTGAIGYCWGGKVVTLGALREGSPFNAISIIHPSITVEEAEGLSIPLGLYYSQGESREDFDKIVGVLSKKPFADKVDSKYYANMIHGWAAARGNLDNPENKREYEDVYSRVAKFFKKALA